jgi:hemerythrin
MAYFEWADDMVIDGGPIDSDHKKLVDLVNELHSATTEGRGFEVIEKIMTELIGYTREHLEREEQLMASLRFPNLERHKIGRMHFAKQLDELQKKYSEGSLTVASQLSTVLRDWLSLHIRRSDKEIKVFLEKRETSKGQRLPS